MNSPARHTATREHCVRCSASHNPRAATLRAALQPSKFSVVGDELVVEPLLLRLQREPLLRLLALAAVARGLLHPERRRVALAPLRLALAPRLARLLAVTLRLALPRRALQLGCLDWLSCHDWINQLSSCDYVCLARARARARTRTCNTIADWSFSYLLAWRLRKSQSATRARDAAWMRVAAASRASESTASCSKMRHSASSSAFWRSSSSRAASRARSAKLVVRRQLRRASPCGGRPALS